VTTTSLWFRTSACQHNGFWRIWFSSSPFTQASTNPTKQVAPRRLPSILQRISHVPAHVTYYTNVIYVLSRPSAILLQQSSVGVSSPLISSTRSPSPSHIFRSRHLSTSNSRAFPLLFPSRMTTLPCWLPCWPDSLVLVPGFNTGFAYISHSRRADEGPELWKAFPGIRRRHEEPLEAYASVPRIVPTFPVAAHAAFSATYAHGLPSYFHEHLAEALLASPPSPMQDKLLAFEENLFERSRSRRVLRVRPSSTMHTPTVQTVRAPASRTRPACVAFCSSQVPHLLFARYILSTSVPIGRPFHYRDTIRHALSSHWPTWSSSHPYLDKSAVLSLCDTVGAVYVWSIYVDVHWLACWFHLSYIYHRI
jgi:hypothetical protein